MQYDARYTQRHINTQQYDARYILRHINALQYDARYTQRQISRMISHKLSNPSGSMKNNEFKCKFTLWGGSRHLGEKCLESMKLQSLSDTVQ